VAPMIIKYREFLQRLTPVVLTQTAGLTCGVVGVKVASRYVPPDVLGDYGIFMSFTTLGMWVVHAGLIKYVGRHWAATESKPALLRQMVQLWFDKLPWIVLGSIGAALSIGQLTGNPTWGLFPSLLIITGVLSLVAMGQTALQVNREHWTDFGVSATGSVTRTFLPLTLFLVIGGAAGLYAGLTFHILIGLGMVAWVMRRHWRAPRNRELSSPQVKEIYTGPYFTFLAMAAWILTGVNRWVIAGFFGDIEAGYFTLASNIALIVPTFAGTVFTQMFQPGFYALGDDDQPMNRNRLSRRVDLVAAGFFAVSLTGVLALHTIMPWLIGPLVHVNYSTALQWIVPVGFFGIAIITGQYFHSMLMAARKERACAPVDLTAATLLILGSVFAAMVGQTTFMQWLMITPLIPWLVTRPLARHFYFKRV
jgi:O-antigen/teichoic acid export membrane protein